MPQFRYKAKKGPKEVVEGTIEAENFDSAVDKITRLGYVPVDVVVDTGTKKPRPTKIKSRRVLFHGRIRSVDTALFTRQLSDLITAGVPLLRALTVVSQQTHNPHLGEVVGAIRDSVQDGGSLSGALAQHPDVFSQVYANMVNAGEISGNLDVVLNRLAEFADQDEETKTKIRTSLIYPALILSVGLVTIFVLLTFVIPRLTVMFDDLAESLPIPTLVLIALSDFFSRFWWAIIALVAAVVLYLRKYYRLSEGKLRIDAIKLRIPVVGQFIKDIEIGRFARTLSTLLGSGVTIVVALDAVWAVVDNGVLKSDIKSMSQEVAGGASLTAALKKSSHFPDIVVNMVAVGEEAGHLEDSLYKLADSYERQSNRSIKVITSLLEPLLIVIIGSIVGCMVIAILLPIFRMNLIIR